MIASTREADATESRLAEARRETERLRRQIARDAPRGDRLGDEILCPAGAPPPPSALRSSPPRPFSADLNRTVPGTAVSSADPTLDPRPRAEHHGRGGQARRRRALHDARARNLSARVEDQRRRLRESFDETERLRETRRSRRRGCSCSSARTVASSSASTREAWTGPSRTRVGWPKSGRERRGNSSRTSNDGKKTKTKTKTRRRAARRKTTTNDDSTPSWRASRVARDTLSHALLRRTLHPPPSP